MTYATDEVIGKMKEFIEQRSISKQINSNVRQEQNFIDVQFKEFIKFDNELADMLLDEPEEVLKVFDIVVKGMDDIPPNFELHVTKLLKTDMLQIQHLRSKHLNKLTEIEGVVFTLSTIRPHITSARFECPSCGNIITVIQTEKNFKEPNKCGCGRKGLFRMLNKHLVDAYSMVVEECPENSNSPTLSKVPVLIKGELTKSQFSDKIYQGLRVKIVGIPKETFLYNKSGKKSTQLDWYLDAISITPFSEDYTTIKISDKDIKEIKRYAEENDVLQVFSEKIFSGIYGFKEEKLGMLLSAFGGVKKAGKLKQIRGDIHTLLVGDPSTAKSTMGEILAKIYPKSRYFSCGKKTSEAGLTASCVKDTLLNIWTIQAGALPMSHGGLCVADELDGLEKEQTKELNEGLERQRITIMKSAKGELKCECSFVGIANPKNGRFDNYASLSDQINLPPPLLSRFDLIFIFRMDYDKDTDLGIADAMLSDDELETTESSDIDFIRKYITYAKKINPKLSTEAKEFIKTKYVEIKQDMTSMEYRNIPITPRDLSSIVRLSEACARARLKDVVELQDAQYGFAIKMYSLKDTSFDPETGLLDVQKVVVGQTLTETKLIRVIEKIFQNKSGETLLYEDLKSLVESEINSVVDDKMFGNVLKKLKHRGDIFEPRPSNFKAL